MSNLTEGDEEEARLEEEQEAKLAELEAEMEKEKESRKLAGASEEEIQKALELLQRQHDAKRKVKFANKGLKGHITTPQGLDDTSMLNGVMPLGFEVRLEMVSSADLFVLIFEPPSSMLTFCLQCWPLVSYVGSLPLMLTACHPFWPLVSNVDSLFPLFNSCLQCWPFVFNFDSLSRVFTPVFLIDSCFQYQPLTFHVDSLATMLTHCFSLWLLVSNVDSISSFLTSCIQCWPFVFRVDSLPPILTLFLSCWLPFLMLTHRFPCWLLVSKFDPVSSMLAPCLQ